MYEIKWDNGSKTAKTYTEAASCLFEVGKLGYTAVILKGFEVVGGVYQTGNTFRQWFPKPAKK